MTTKGLLLLVQAFSWALQHDHSEDNVVGAGSVGALDQPTPQTVGAVQWPANLYAQSTGAESTSSPESIASCTTGDGAEPETPRKPERPRMELRTLSLRESSLPTIKTSA